MEEQQTTELWHIQAFVKNGMNSYYVVCQYYPPGNYQGEYAKQVAPLGTTTDDNNNTDNTDNNTDNTDNNTDNSGGDGDNNTEDTDQVTEDPDKPSTAPSTTTFGIALFSLIVGFVLL